ncbi:uncharacterized protein PV09_05284 [Verruconis gallopava]|uniref:Major facilitator superfamily (MFS) profile domain-containing protein n=1 Tax=Verruconis gallopava TaxID=253628 RepID=A0A0D2AWL4_9PEZI|nr:uncharacterized protein PV09_05284 [Verruconis gallopava]KIW03519.1 hypothetical protein PV09_05284 [Verruconis gallopava]
MSLAQHVSAAEGFDRDPDVFDDLASLPLQLSRVSSRQRRTSISYDPVPSDPLAQQVKKLEPVAAYEVSFKKRLAQVIIGVISCTLGSGIVFGFAALKPILIDRDAYRELCTEQELRDGVVVCYMQDLKLNLAFNMASVTTNVSALLVGALLDRYGPRFCGLISAVVLFLGSLCLGFEHELPFDAVMAGHVLVSLGGTFIFVPSFHLSNAFPRYQGLILALVTGAFDASAAVFLGFRLIYERTQKTFGLKQLFLAYLAVPTFIFITQLFIMPSKIYENRIELQEAAERAQNPAQDVHDSDDDLEDSELWRVRTMRAEDRKRIRAEVQSLLGDADEQAKHDEKEVERHIRSQAWGALHGLPVIEQIRTPWFIFITLFTILQMARMNFFIATIWSQYRYMLQSIDLANRINKLFDIALPIAGVATVPFIGTLLDNLPVSGVLALVVGISTLIGVLGVLPFLWAGYANVIVFCLFRPLYYSAMSDYAVKVFGLATFGTIYGTIVCISGLLTFTQSAMQALTHQAFHDDPTPVNLSLAGLGLVIGVALVTYVAVAGKHVQHEVLEEEERRSQMPSDATPRLRPYMSPSLGPSYGTMRSGRGPPSLRPSLANLRQLDAVNEEAVPGNSNENHVNHLGLS